jgi:2,3-bisphosphoglycerate-independent phosphoglycerate mutase
MLSKNKKRIVILIGDGMADYPVDGLEGRTPLEAASTPNMDYMARNGILGMVKTVPDGMSPGSDVANLSIFGYDPAHCFTGRAPLEALNMGIELDPGDVAFRCNLVNIENGIMRDFSADHIDTGFSEIIIRELQKGIGNKEIEFYPGVSYRNLLIWRDYPFGSIPGTTPPHDIQNKEILAFLPDGPGSDELLRIMEESQRILRGSYIIRDKLSRFKGNPSSIWLWGGGRKPAMETLEKRFGLNGYTISAVDLIHGIGRAAGLSPLPVEGVTGYIDTNYTGKANALLTAIQDSNFVYLHVEAPDEAGHEGNLNHKIRAIEDFDGKVVGKVLQGIRDYSDYSILVMPDHPTPLIIRTHSSAPVPFCIYANKGITGFRASAGDVSFNEKSASLSGNYIDKAHDLIEIMLDRGIRS